MNGWYSETHAGAKIPRFPRGAFLWQCVYERPSANEKNLVAIFIWGRSERSCPVRDEWIGWSARVRVSRLQHVIELRVECILLPQNGMRYLYAALQHVSVQWEEIAEVRPLLAVRPIDGKTQTLTSRDLDMAMKPTKILCYETPLGTKYLYIYELQDRARYFLCRPSGLPQTANNHEMQAMRPETLTCADLIKRVALFSRILAAKRRTGNYSNGTLAAILSIGYECGVENQKCLQILEKLTQAQRKALGIRRPNKSQPFTLPSYNTLRLFEKSMDKRQFRNLHREWNLGDLRT